MRIAVYSGDGVRESVADLFEWDLEDESAVVCAVVLELVCDKVSPPVCLCARDCVAEDAGGTDARISSRSAQAGLGEGERTMSCLGLTIWPLSSERRCRGRASEAASLSRSGTIRSQGATRSTSRFFRCAHISRNLFLPLVPPLFAPSAQLAQPLSSPSSVVVASPSPFPLCSPVTPGSCVCPQTRTRKTNTLVVTEGPLRISPVRPPPSLPSPSHTPPQLFFLLLETEVANAQD